jgi:hypothetical protein
LIYCCVSRKIELNIQKHNQLRIANINMIKHEYKGIRKSKLSKTEAGIAQSVQLWATAWSVEVQLPAEVSDFSFPYGVQICSVTQQTSCNLRTRSKESGFEAEQSPPPSSKLNNNNNIIVVVTVFILCSVSFFVCVVVVCCVSFVRGVILCDVCYLFVVCYLYYHCHRVKTHLQLK